MTCSNRSTDWRALAYIGGLALMTAILFGAAPALRARRLDLAAALRSSARGLAGGIWGSAGKRLGLGKLLVAVQIALSLALLVGTAMLARSVSNLRSADAGIASDEIVMADLAPEAAGYEGEAFAAIGLTLAERIASIPGVQAVSFSENGVFSGTESGTSHTIPGFIARTAQDTVTNYDNVGPRYFEAIGARILAGRGIDARDGPSAQAVAVVNETMARFYWDGNALGRQLIVDDRMYEIVGVIADVKNQALRDDPIRRFYLPWLQTKSAPSSMSLEIRAPGAQPSLIAEVRDRITQVDATIPIRRISPLAERMERSINQEKLLSRVIAFAGGLALLLAAIGLYGVMAYATIQRTGEFGLRLALGARPGELAAMVFRETMIVVATGVLIGVPAALAAVRLVRNQLFGVDALDIPSFAIALVILAGSALAAGYIPAARASRVGPLVALREE
jgi:predicted permease